MLNSTETVYNISVENPNTPRTPLPAARKKRFKDRKEGRFLRTLPAMNKFIPFIMPTRNDALNQFADEFDITEADALCHQMIASGRTNFSILHIILAAYVRTVAQRPALNRFINGQRIYARNDIAVVMTIKKAMTAEAPDTCIKVHFAPDDTIYDIYDKFNAVVEQNKQTEDLDSDFDKTANTLASLPRPILRATVRLLNWLDYHGWLPKFLTELSPFHGSMIITSMGSLGIKPVYHHIYNFGNLPIFISYGKKENGIRINRRGESEVYRKIDVKVVTDERICDGFVYAAAFKAIKKYIEKPACLLERPTAVLDDID